MKSSVISYITLTGLVIILLISSCEFTAATIESESTALLTTPAVTSSNVLETTGVPDTSAPTGELSTSATSNSSPQSETKIPEPTIVSPDTPTVTFVPLPDATTTAAQSDSPVTPPISTTMTGATSFTTPILTTTSSTIPSPRPSFSEITVAPPSNTYPYDAVVKPVVAEIFGYEG